MKRSYDRANTEMRPVHIQPFFLKHNDSNVLIEYGETKVICNCSVDSGVPGWLRGKNQGWLTAEYSMLPSATSTRSRRERKGVGGRTQEIQRLIGRSLRGIIDLNKCPEITFMIDCDVIQADGGTRTASITGAMIALKMAVQSCLRKGLLKENPLSGSVAAVSIGIKQENILVDLDYSEDSTADLDMNIVLNNDKKLLELQGTAERQAFSKEQVLAIIEAAENSLTNVFELQNRAADGETIES